MLLPRLLVRLLVLLSIAAVANTAQAQLQFIYQGKINDYAADLRRPATYPWTTAQWNDVSFFEQELINLNRLDELSAFYLAFMPPLDEYAQILRLARALSDIDAKTASELDRMIAEMDALLRLTDTNAQARRTVAQIQGARSQFLGHASKPRSQRLAKTQWLSDFGEASRNTGVGPAVIKVTVSRELLMRDLSGWRRSARAVMTILRQASLVDAQDKATESVAELERLQRGDNAYPRPDGDLNVCRKAERPTTTAWELFELLVLPDIEDLPAIARLTERLGESDPTPSALLASMRESGEALLRKARERPESMRKLIHLQANRRSVAALCARGATGNKSAQTEMEELVKAIQAELGDHKALAGKAGRYLYWTIAHRGSEQRISAVFGAAAFEAGVWTLQAAVESMAKVKSEIWAGYKRRGDVLLQQMREDDLRKEAEDAQTREWEKANCFFAEDPLDPKKRVYQCPRR